MPDKGNKWRELRVTDVSKYGRGQIIVDSSTDGCLQPIRVIKYLNGEPVSEEWQTAKQLPLNSWGRKKPPQTRFCPSCKKSYETNNARKKFCYDCSAMKIKRRRDERCIQEREARKLNPTPRVRQRSKYS